MVREKYKGREGRDEEHQMNYWNKQRNREEWKTTLMQRKTKTNGTRIREIAG